MNRTITIAALILAASAPALRADAAPFKDLSLDDALAQAKKDDKPVLIDFYTTWCTPCKIMDETVFKDDKVIALLNEKTVAIKLDAEKHEAIAARYRVDTFPTFLFVKSDGSEMDRIVGGMETDPFLNEVRAALSGKDRLQRAKERLDKAGRNNPSARMDYADVLAQAGRHEEALKEYLWCWDQGIQHDAAFAGARVSFLLDSIGRLAKSYPQALVELRKRRDEARKQLLADSNQSAPIDVFQMPAMDFARLNEVLNEHEETLRVYDELRAKDPTSIDVLMLQTLVFDALLAQKRYEEIAASTNLRDSVVEAVRSSQADLEFLPEGQRQEVARIQRRFAVEQLAKYYEVYLGLGKTMYARDVASKAIKLIDDAETYNTLAWHGYLTGKPFEANLEQAKKAYDLTEGRAAHIVDTYARVLNKLGKHDEACTVLREALHATTDDQQEKLIRETAREIDCPLKTTSE